MPLILLGGITNRETMDLAMAEGFDFVAMARLPQFVGTFRGSAERLCW
jgi:2,4-dienoyl-CoA reductase-like NADH-dependent reductase (Old Yellow Enzyme family)